MMRSLRPIVRIGIGAGCLAVLLVALAVTVRRDGSQQVRVPTGLASGSNSSPPAKTPSASSSATTRGPSASGSVSGATIAPSGTAYAPPASVVYPSPTPTSTRVVPTTTPPPSGDTVTVTQDDNGKTVTLRRGQHLVVSLSDTGWMWSDPDTDNAKVLERKAVSANPSSDQVTASFDAMAAGQAHVSASKDAPCRRSQPPCMVPTYLWQITVNVV